MSITIRTPQTNAEWQTYYQLRWEILRAPWNQPPGSEQDEHENCAFHVMALNNEQIIGVGRLHLVNNKTGQIRYMVVRPDQQGMGIGSKILAALEDHALSMAYEKLVLNARDSALEFYKQHGYDCLDKAETLFDEITHTRMQKELNCQATTNIQDNADFSPGY